MPSIARNGALARTCARQDSSGVRAMREKRREFPLRLRLLAMVVQDGRIRRQAGGGGLRNGRRNEICS
jgi:hypothetical protein